MASIPASSFSTNSVLGIGQADLSAAYSQPRRVFALYYPLILAVTSLLMWLEPDDRMLLVGSTAGTAIAVLLAWDFLFVGGSIKLTRVTTLGLLLGYAAGTFNSYMTYPRAGYPLASVTSLSEPVLTRGVAAVLIACAFLLSAGELLEPPLLTGERVLLIGSDVKKILAVCILALVGAAATGRVQQGGFTLAGNGHAGFLALFFGFLLGPTVALTTAAFLNERHQGTRYLLGLATALVWVIDVSQGRRNLIYPALLAVMLSRWAGYDWRELRLKTILLGVVGISFLTTGVLFYTLLRATTYQLGSKSTLTERITLAVKWVEQGTALTAAQTAIAPDVHKRTLIIGFLADLIDVSGQHTPALGANFVNQVGWLMPNGFKWEGMSEENLANEVFDRAYPDQANSILTGGVVDFGLLGMFLYPLPIVLVFAAGMRGMKRKFRAGVFLFAFAAAIDTAIQAESNLINDWLEIRQIIVFSVLLFFITKIPLLKMSEGETNAL